MNKPNYSVIRLTRVLTMISIVVLVGVGIYSAMLAVEETLIKHTISLRTEDTGNVIIIDPGHGGEDGGTQSESGALEKDINLSVSLVLRDIFDFFGFSTVMTRDSDRLIYDWGAETVREKKVSDIKNRMKLIEENTDGIFLSIHQNYFTDNRYSGAQTFYSVNNPLSEALASEIQKCIVALIQKDNNRETKASGSNIYLLHHSRIPTVMVECGFLSNYEESLSLIEPDYQKQMAFAVFSGVYNYFVKNG